MPTRNISLTPEQDAFIEKAVEAGEYQNASEAVRDALRALQQRRREDALKLKALRLQIKAGVEALDRGEFTEVADADLDRYLEGLSAKAAKRAR
jgi:antitoxin ParD1/3/4